MKKIKEDIIQLEIANAKMAQRVAEDLFERKSKFLDIAAHELRTPITIISLLLQLAEKKKEQTQTASSEILSKLRAPVERLSKLAVDLLDLSRLERGLVELLSEQTNMVNFISECIEEFRIQVPKRSILFTKPHYTIESKIDPLRINQVLTNLLDNAVKYTREGPIEVTLENIPNATRISVIDYGPGIPKDVQQTLFNAFSRGKTDATIRTAGLGLGLSVSKEIIELHGGVIGVESENSLGSTFYFDLPLEICHR
jgi:signal transduction histidine kinase